LEVVAKRLAQCGLAQFCLEAHSHQTSRGAVVSDLGQALYEKYPEQAPLLEPLARLAELRTELNAYTRALHSPVMPLGETPFHVYARLAAIRDAPDLYFELAAI